MAEKIESDQTKAWDTWFATLTPEQRASVPPGSMRASSLEPEAERLRRMASDRDREKHRGPRRQVSPLQGA